MPLGIRHTPRHCISRSFDLVLENFVPISVGHHVHFLKGQPNPLVLKINIQKRYKHVLIRRSHVVLEQTRVRKSNLCHGNETSVNAATNVSLELVSPSPNLSN
ncbi:hypothetical protein PNOK_0333000 [Pyrrhoderma noxium]|uniref:Uncharacterized protein n=1 Tax=Pyrrhoderma noxium TaxID=2282107 RepID=A0A286UM79_9AGAM|nr:hypothetical protein PNOK_0333000 [Pyrrhoderma noxium]